MDLEDIWIVREASLVFDTTLGLVQLNGSILPTTIEFSEVFAVESNTLHAVKVNTRRSTNGTYQPHVFNPESLIINLVFRHLGLSANRREKKREFNGFITANEK
ncbi:hypothetical protein C8Q75DRAFT_732088 [Abortiporus biennis]|nr:hypothetical protein C8Q75DRAFT_732080 [Abortiporus biennis]KAI0791676.1 hypothetical protein C8Q75DRAFT_732084 [Abortiporus biennis]KAI0791680.1 hypothetical protein C8Q75DRAFT_732088 [Abortiporus biennis]